MGRWSLSESLCLTLTAGQKLFSPLDSCFMMNPTHYSFLTCFVHRVRGKMRFWSRSKHGDKMSSRGRSADSELSDRRNGASCFFYMFSPHVSCTNVVSLSDSPPGSPERCRDSKENREPLMVGMMSMKRRRSVKISSVSLESNAWQNDSLHILTNTSDYRCMNDFLMKKVLFSA